MLGVDTADAGYAADDAHVADGAEAAHVAPVTELQERTDVSVSSKILHFFSCFFSVSVSSKILHFLSFCSGIDKAFFFA